MPTSPPEPVRPLDIHDDRELLERVRAGETKAFEELYRRHYPDAKRYATRLVSGRASQVDDVVADAMTSALTAIDKGLGPVDTFRPYLFTAVRRHAQRTRSRREFPYQDTDVLTHDEPDDRLDSGQSLVMRAFESLPQRWREILYLVELEGYSFAEVATRLGLSPNATSALLYRARAGLREAYRQVDAGGPAKDSVARQTA